MKPLTDDIEICVCVKMRSCLFLVIAYIHSNSLQFIDKND